MAEHVTDLTDALLLIAVVVGLAIVSRWAAGVGTRWIERKLLHEPLDPNKPIVRRHPLGD